MVISQNQPGLFIHRLPLFEIHDALNYQGPIAYISYAASPSKLQY